MGKIAHKFANNIYITDDNPRNEKPELIRKQIQQNCPLAYNIGSRSIAIKTAIEHLDSNEYLIIAGKGHEKKQIFKNKVVSFNDVKIAKLFIKKINTNAYK